MPRPRKTQTVKADDSAPPGVVVISHGPIPHAAPRPTTPARRIALLAVDSASRPDALAQAELAANERSAALAAAGATVLSIHAQCVYGSPWYVIVMIEYEGGRDEHR